MRKSNEELVRYLNERRIKVAEDSKETKDVCLYMKNKYNVPIEVTSDLICRKGADEYSRFILYGILERIGGNLKTEDFFTQQEIDFYSHQKYEEPKISFPLRIRAVQIADNQFIGKISAKELMKLRDAQMINYNANTQRTMKLVIRGETKQWRITLDKGAVKSIQDSMREKTFISNTITLNMPEDTVYAYDDESCTLYIREIKYFDILDGYHRYIAMSNEYNTNRSFDYPMELRIVCFPEYKAKQMIFQEDQKTKMKALDSKYFDQTNSGNKVVARLNEDPTCNLSGLLVLNGGIINPAELSVLISQYWFRGQISKAETKIRIIEVTKNLKEKFNYITEEDPAYLKQWDYRTLAATVWLTTQEDVPLQDYLILIPILANESKQLSKGFVINRNGTSRKLQNLFIAKKEEFYAEKAR